MPHTELRERLARIAATVRRAVLGRRRSLAFLSACGAVLAALGVLAPPPPDTVGVLVAIRDLPAGTVLGADDLDVRRLPPGSAPDGALPRRDLVGRTIAAPVRRGEPVTDVRVVSESLLDGYPGLVAVPVRIPDPGAVGLLAVGDRVDVLAADPAGAGPAETVAADALVIALPVDDPDSPVAAGGVLGGRLVVLGVAETTARDLAGRAAGAFLSLVIAR